MKKLLKHEWRFYLGITLLLTVILIGWHLGGEYYPWGEYAIEIDTIFFFLPDLVESMCHIEVENIVITVVAYCLLKLYQYWTERNSHGRDFLAVLPVQKKERECFYLLADAAFILLPNIAYILMKYACLKVMFARGHIVVPWLFDAVPPMLLTTAAYLLMLFAVSRFIESLIVNGVWKIFGSAAVIVMCIMSLICLETGETFLLIGERGYMIYFGDWEEYERKYEEIYDRGFDVEDVELTDLYHGEYGIGLEVYYEGEPIEEAVYRLEAHYRERGDYYSKSRSVYLAASEWLDYDLEMRRLVNYGKIPDMPFVLGNLALAAALIVLIVRLAGRREVSETILYFRFVKYIFAVLASMTVLCMTLQLETKIWQKGLLVLASVGVFVLCVNWLTPREERWIGKERKE